MPAEKLSISLPEGLAAHVDALAASDGARRSYLIQEAAAQYVASREGQARDQARRAAVGSAIEGFDSVAALRGPDEAASGSPGRVRGEEMPQRRRRPVGARTVTEPGLVVLDSSVGVKWISLRRGVSLRCGCSRPSGMARCASWSPPTSSTRSLQSPSATPGRRWPCSVGGLDSAQLTVIGLDDRLAMAALDQCSALGCTFYDALAPALAQELGATLYSADARAHSCFEGVQLI